MNLRVASADDAELILDWRNDPETRRASRKQGAGTWEEHQRWLEHTLRSTDRLLLVAEDNGTPIGVLRFDLIDSMRWEVSINVAPERRGKGVGVMILQEGSRWFSGHVGLGVLEARVRENNARSLRAFRKAGFSDAGKEGELMVLVKRMTPEA